MKTLIKRLFSLKLSKNGCKHNSVTTRLKVSLQMSL